MHLHVVARHDIVCSVYSCRAQQSSPAAFRQKWTPAQRAGACSAAATLASTPRRAAAFVLIPGRAYEAPAHWGNSGVSLACAGEGSAMHARHALCSAVIWRRLRYRRSRGGTWRWTAQMRWRSGCAATGASTWPACARTTGSSAPPRTTCGRPSFLRGARTHACMRARRPRRFQHQRSDLPRTGLRACFATSLMQIQCSKPACSPMPEHACVVPVHCSTVAG